MPGNFWGDEAATFAHAVDAGLVVPMHYDMFAFNTETPALFAATADRIGQPHRVLRLGECARKEAPMTLTEPLTVDTVTVERVAKTIDHSLLKPELTIDEVLAGCALAAEYDVASVCCRPLDVERCRDALAGTDVLVGTVVGFPHGAHLTATKVFEAERAIEQGAVELDMVIAIGMLRSGELDYVRDDIAAVVDATGDAAIVKVILENAYLDGRPEGRRLPARRGGRRGLRQDVDGLRADGRHARRPAPDAGHGVAARQGQGGRWRAHARRPDRLPQRRHRPLWRHRDGGHHRRPPGAPGRLSREPLARARPRRHQHQGRRPRRRPGRRARDDADRGHGRAPRRWSPS